MAISEVTVDDLANALEGPAQVRLVDVRETDEYVEGHVPGAIHVPLATVPDNLEVFRSDGPLYVICKSGGRSMRACEWLADEGIEATNVAGGTMAWQLSGRAVATGTTPS